MKRYYYKKDKYDNAYSLHHNGLKPDITSNSINRRMDLKSIVDWYNRIICINKVEWIIDKCKKMDKSSVHYSEQNKLDSRVRIQEFIFSICCTECSYCIFYITTLSSRINRTDLWWKKVRTSFWQWRNRRKSMNEGTFGVDWKCSISLMRFVIQRCIHLLKFIKLFTWDLCILMYINISKTLNKWQMLKIYISPKKSKRFKLHRSQYPW